MLETQQESKKRRKEMYTSCNIISSKYISQNELNKSQELYRPCGDLIWNFESLCQKITYSNIMLAGRPRPLHQPQDEPHL